MTESSIDLETRRTLERLSEIESVRKNRVAEVQTVLVVLSGKAQTFDLDAIRHKLSRAYPDAAVFFETTSGKSVGVQRPERVDLLIDFTGPGHRESFFRARKLRKIARYAVGRPAGWFRPKIYDRLIEEVVENDLLVREHAAQSRVLELSGVALAPVGDTTPDRAKVIALELPPLS